MVALNFDSEFLQKQLTTRYAACLNECANLTVALNLTKNPTRSVYKWLRDPDETWLVDTVPVGPMQRVFAMHY